MNQPVTDPLVTHNLKDNLRTRLFQTVLWATIGATIVYAFILRFSGNIPDRFTLFFILIPLPVCALLLLALRRGYIQFSAIAFTTLTWIVMFFGALMAGGIQSPAYSGFILPILFAGWLLGKREGLFVALLSALAGLFLVVAYSNGWAVDRAANTNFSIWVSQLFFFCIAAAILYISIDSSDKVIEQAEQSERSEREINAKLRAEVDARKSAEKELRFQANVLSQVQDAIIVSNVEREIIYWNQGAEMLYGIPREETLHRNIAEVLQFDDAENPHDSERAKALLTTGTWQGDEETVVRATGKRVIVGSRAQLILDELGGPSHVIVSARDIRTRVEAQEALTYRTELQQLVTQLATRFINLPTSEMNQGITEALKLFCEFFQAKRGVIGLFSADLKTLTFEHEYLAAISTLTPRSTVVMPTSDISWSMTFLTRFEPVIVSSIDALPPEAAADQIAFQRNGTKSFIGIPIVQHETLIGILGYSSDNEQFAWPGDMLSQLHVLSQLIVNLFERRTFEENLRTRDAELNASTTRLGTLLEIDRTIFAAQSLQDVAASALKRLFELCNCKYNSIFLIDDALESGYYFAQYPPRDTPVFHKSVPLAAITDLDDLRDGLILLNGAFGEGDCPVREQEIAVQTGAKAMARLPLKASGHLIGILYLGFDEGDAFERLDIELIEGIAASLALAIANTQLYEQVQFNASELEDKIAESTAELTHQYNIQSALATIELAINEPSELERVLEQIVNVTTQTLPADKGVSIVLWDPETENYTVGATSVKGQEKSTLVTSLRKEGGATRWILDHAEMLIVTDTKADPFGPNQMILEQSIGAYAGVPLSFEGRTIGVLYALMAQPQSFTEDEIDFLKTVARRAALAITKVSLFKRAREVAAEDERKRLARDLHDAVSQSLFSASVISESLPIILERDPERAKQELKTLSLLTKGAVNEMRSLLFELRPTTLTSKTLSELLQQLCSAFSGRTQIPISSEIESGIHFSSSLQISIYRIAQEAFNNVTKYARARNLWVEMSYKDEGFRLMIRDDGRGFDPHNIPIDHMGFQIMSERAEEIGATLKIDSTINVGTTISLYRRFNKSENYNEQFEYDTHPVS